MKSCLSIIAMMCCLLVTGQVSAGHQEELENLRQRIHTMQSEMGKTSESRSEAADALRNSERAISESNRQLAQISLQQHDADEKLHALQIQQQQLNLSIVKQQKLLGSLLHQQYLGSEHAYLKLMLNNQDPNKTARDLQYFQYIARNRAEWLDSLRANVAALNTVTQEAKIQSEILEKLHKEHDQKKDQLKQEQQQRSQVLADVSKQLTLQRREITRLQLDESRLSNLVTKIARMLAKPAKKSFFKNDTLPERQFSDQPFTQNIGKLILPVKGEISNRFGTPRPDSTVVWKGLFIKATTGKTIRAVAPGRVVFADWLRGFGNLLIIDHGNVYMSLYGNNESLLKQVGDEIKGGETIATVGNSGGNTDSGLYFELRHESLPLDPLKWLAKN